MNGYNFRFLDWSVYKDAKKLNSFVILLVKKLPPMYQMSFGQQILRSCLSITLNIAEGSAKNSDTDFKRFINIASGSLTETVANADILNDNGLISKEDFAKILAFSDAIAKQLGALRKKLLK